MTEKFDNFIREILTEAKRCEGPSLRQLSDKANYRWMACKENPYSPGYKRVYWGRRGKAVNLNHCKTAVPGQARYYECQDTMRAILRRKLLRKRLEMLRAAKRRD